MVKHVIVWTLKDELSESEKTEVKAGIKSSNADLMLDSVFESEEALNGYSVNPAHVEVATNKVRPFVKTRSCFDFNI